MAPSISGRFSHNATNYAGNPPLSADCPLRRVKSLPNLAYPTSVQNIEASLSAHGGGELIALSGQDLVPVLEHLHRALESAGAELLEGLHGENQREAEQLQAGIEQLVAANIEDASRAAAPGTPPHAILEEVRAQLAQTQAGPLTLPQRASVVLDHIGALLLNNFDRNQSAAGRWTRNIAAVGLRTGLIVGITTTLRQLLGFALEKACQQSAISMTPRIASGVAAMLIGPGLNLAGFVRDEQNHSASTHSRLSRVAMLTLSAGALAAAAATDTPGVLGLMGSFGLQMASYTFARDLAQLFFPMHDNAGLNLPGTVASGAAYATNQFALGEAMDNLVPQSGAGYPMSVATAARSSPVSANADTAQQSSITPLVDWALGSNVTANPTPAPGQDMAQARVWAAMEDLRPNLQHDAVRGLLNAVVEVFDDVVSPGLRRRFDVAKRTGRARADATRRGECPEAAVRALPLEETEGLRVGLSTPRLGREHWPTRSQMADQFLNTGAARTSFFQSVLGIALATATAVGTTNLSSEAQGTVVNAVVASLVALAYTPFLYTHSQRNPDAPRQPEGFDSSSR